MSPIILNENLPRLRPAHAKNAFARILTEAREGLRLRAGGLCGHARAHSSARQLTGEGKAFDDHASVEANACRGGCCANTYAYKTTQSSFPNCGSFTAHVLAAPLLRFQCVESEEVRREASVYAYESG